jgi:hypothetical protein
MTEQHPLRKSCDSMDQRHTHEPYTLPAGAAQRCSCGHRVFKITIGGLVPPSVACAKCGTQNRTATMYERGRTSD